jgi:hypothetical protein
MSFETGDLLHAFEAPDANVVVGEAMGAHELLRVPRKTNIANLTAGMGFLYNSLGKSTKGFDGFVIVAPC